MTPADLSGVKAVAAVAFPDHPEDLACFAERRSLSPDLCFVLAGEGGVQGYLVAYPWRRGAAPPPLNTLIGAVPDEAAFLYLHDLALSPAALGGGHARRAIDLLVERARAGGTEEIALVSVNDSVPFWTAMGFTVRTGDPTMPAKLASYGADARYMTRRL